MMRSGLPAYLAAALLGLAAGLWIFPLDFILPAAGRGWHLGGDASQHIIAQRWFLSEPWTWPPLMVRTLNTPEGMNLAFADGIPLLAIPLKLIAPLLPAGFHGIGLWHLLCWVLQPVGAVFLLRSAGEKRLLAAIGVAFLALGMPAWLARYGHAALCGHFLLMLALGLYLRCVNAPSRATFIAMVLLQPATLLIHPYLAIMTLALLLAMRITLGVRRSDWAGAAGNANAVGFGLVFLILWGFGYVGAGGDRGFGYYALNLLSPVWPYHSWLLGGLAPERVNAGGIGNGWEGYNWIGLGAALLILLAIALSWRAIGPMIRRHLGLALGLLGLTVLAISPRVGLGSMVLLDLGPIHDVLEQFRSSGRFFWPVAYAVVLAAAVLVCRATRFGPAIVLALGLVQFIDAQPLRAELQSWANTRHPWSFDAAAMRDAFAAHDRVTLLPTWRCAPDAPPSYPFDRQMEVLDLLSERPRPANTMYLARWSRLPQCDDAAIASAPLAPGELRLIMPDSRARDLPLVPDAARYCRDIGDIAACSLTR